MSRVLSLTPLLMLCLLFWTAPAAGQSAPGAPLPYAPWDGESALGEPPPLADELPRALPRARDFSRRTVELGPELGFALPSCAGRVDASSPCGALAPGLFVGLTALWRPSPYFAFGGGLHMADFGSKADMTPALASGRLYEASALARVFLLESGRVEPYFELALGGSSQSTAAAPLAQPRLEQRSLAVGGRVGGGVDFYIGEHLRLGPSLGVLRYFTGSSDSCIAGRCSATSLDQRGQLLGAYVLALRATLGFGSRL